ncbi:MAG: diguanylate cyclase [Steroidobacteraceae bacterium]
MGLQLDAAAAESATPGVPAALAKLPGEWIALAAGEREHEDADAPGLPVIAVRKSRRLGVELYLETPRDGLEASIERLPVVARLPVFSGEHDELYALPLAETVEPRVWLRIDAESEGAPPRMGAWRSRLDVELARGAENARMIALASGALLAVSICAALIWLVLADRLLLLYAGLFSLQAVYIVFLSGQGFDWPWLKALEPAGSHAWNIPAALSGTFACLFVREIAELKRFSPLVYRIFGGMAYAFLAIGAANLLRPLGFHTIVTTLGNLLFAVSALFTLVVALLAWMRGIRAAGWFLLAWVLLETLTILVALRLIVVEPQSTEGLLYYGLPLSMVAASILIALGVADRLREQRQALTVAERHAQTDPLTGVLNRRALTERLNAACVRARARGLPISVLFIDLDHFKQINDSFGHAAGDACLRQVVAPIQSELRQSDAIGRIGGEEFVVLLSSADYVAALPVAERIRARVAELRVGGYGPDIRLTCSIGVASSDRLQLWDEALIDRADAAVYRAKRAGRDQVQTAEPEAALSA